MAVITNNSTQRDGYSYTYFYPNGTTIGPLWQWSSYKGTFDQRSKVSVPDYRRRIAQHQDATGPYSRTIRRYEVVDGFAEKRTIFLNGTQQGVTLYGNLLVDAGNLILPSVNFNPALSRVRARVSANMWNRLRNMTFDGSTFAGELRESIRMIRSPAKGIMDMTSTWLHSLRRYPKRRDTIKAAGDAYLELSFGWLPLASSVEDAINATRKLSTDSRVERASVRAFEQVHADTRTGYQYSPQGVIFDANVRTEGSVLCTGGAGIIHEASSFAAEATDNFGLTVQDFVPAAWELLPWSFLVDYFVNIGDVITAGMTVEPRTSFGYNTTKVVRKTTITGTINPKANQVGKYLVAYGNFGTYSYEEITFSRGQGIWPRPTIVFDASLTEGQALNIGALTLSYKDTLRRLFS